MKHGIRVRIDSSNASQSVEAVRYRPAEADSLAYPARPAACVWSVNRHAERSQGVSHEGVKHLVSVHIKSCDPAWTVDLDGHGSLRWPCACPRKIEGRECAIRSTYKAVTNSICVHIKSRDPERRVDAQWDGSAMTDICRRPGYIEFGDRAVRSEQEAVVRVARVGVHSRDISYYFYFYGEGSLILGGAGAGSIEGANRSRSRCAHEAVSRVGIVDADSRSISSCVITDCQSSLQCGLTDAQTRRRRAKRSVNQAASLAMLF